MMKENYLPKTLPLILQNTILGEMVQDGTLPESLAIELETARHNAVAIQLDPEASFRELTVAEYAITYYTNQTVPLIAQRRMIRALSKSIQQPVELLDKIHAAAEPTRNAVKFATETTLTTERESPTLDRRRERAAKQAHDDATQILASCRRFRAVNGGFWPELDRAFYSIEQQAAQLVPGAYVEEKTDGEIKSTRSEIQFTNLDTGQPVDFDPETKRKIAALIDAVTAGPYETTEQSEAASA